MGQTFRLMLDVKVPMRDGVNLSADIWLPPGEGPWPTLLLRTIYNNQRAGTIRSSTRR